MNYFEEFYATYQKMYPAMFSNVDLLESLDKIVPESALSHGDVHHVLCSIAITRRNNALLHFCTASIKYHELPTESLYEVLLQSHLFLGFPAMIEALRLAHQTCPLPSDVHTGDQSEIQEYRISGEELCRQIYGEHYLSLVRFTNRLHPELTNWMIEHGYGRVLSRPKLSPYRREIAILPILMITGYDRQLAAHVRGFVNLGGDKTAIGSIFDVVALFIPNDQENRVAEFLKGAIPDLV